MIKEDTKYKKIYIQIKPVQLSPFPVYPLEHEQ